MDPFWQLIADKLDHPPIYAAIIGALITGLITWRVSKWKADSVSSQKTAQNQPTIQNTIVLPSETRPKPSPLSNPESASTTGKKIDLSRLPAPATGLVGRRAELAELTVCFNDPQVAAVGIIAAGGIGKSALVDAWLTDIRPDFAGVRRVFAWSFHSQGNQSAQSSSALFFENALPFFDHPGPIPKPDAEKATTLIDCLKKETFLLVLDGVEPLQYPPTIQDGQFRDDGLLELMRQIKGHALSGHTSSSVILITSRQPIPTLATRENDLYRTIDLQPFSIGDGTQILKQLGVNKGLDHEYQDAVDGLGGHALALVLLGNLLKKQYESDIAHWPQVKKNLFDPDQEPNPAKKIMAYYDRNLWSETDPEPVFLRLLGLFDRPMEEAAFETLRNRAEIAQPLKELPTERFNALIINLQRAGMLDLQRDPLGEKIWDAHPLVREYFGQAFAREQPERFKQAHRVLFEFFQRVPEKQQPDTLAELEPLYRAVHHGCRAGAYKQAMDDVLWERIYRGNEFYSSKKLGAYSSNLSALSGFFPQGWAQPPVSGGLSEGDQGWLLAQASFTLMSLGRMAEAVGPRRSVMEIRQKLEDWKQSAISARNLVDLLLPTGQLQEARRVVERGIGWAEKTDDLLEKMKSQAYLATSLHRLGELSAGETAFQEAERLQQEFQPSNPQLYSVWGAQYAALLLDQAGDERTRKAVLERGRYAQKIAHKNKFLLGTALNDLTQGRALAALGRTSEARRHLDAAVEGIRKAGVTLFTPNFLLHRAAFLRKQGQQKPARNDLEEALEIIERSGLYLYEADARLLEVLFVSDWQTPGSRVRIFSAMLSHGIHLDLEGRHGQVWKYWAPFDRDWPAVAGTCTGL